MKNVVQRSFELPPPQQDIDVTKVFSFNVIPNLFRAGHSEPTGERIQLMMADRGQEVRRSGDLEGKKIGRYEGKLLSVNSLSSNPPTLLSSNNHPSPQPSSIGEGAFRHSEAQRAERIQPIMADGSQEVRRSGWYNKRTLTNYTNIVLNENSLPSCPLNFRSSDNQPFTLHRPSLFTIL